MLRLFSEATQVDRPKYFVMLNMWVVNLGSLIYRIVCTRSSNHMGIDVQNDKPTEMDDITLDMEIETVRALGYRIVDIIADELADPARRPPKPPKPSHETLEALFGGPLPQGGVAPDELLTTVHNHCL
jgi:hypothetical protein